MAIDKYLVIRKAAEIDEIIRRLDMISDVNAAFSGNKDHTKGLEKRFHRLVGNNQETNLDTPKDNDWVKRLSRFKR
jgi:hypothetical protein